MSLDFSLGHQGWIEDYSFNITHNLIPMAEACGLYKALWHPYEAGIKTARDLLPHLRAGVVTLTREPEKYRAMNPPNGWGNYDDFVAYIEMLIGACQDYPDSEVRASV